MPPLVADPEERAVYGPEFKKARCCRPQFCPPRAGLEPFHGCPVQFRHVLENFAGVKVTAVVRVPDGHQFAVFALLRGGIAREEPLWLAHGNRQ